MTLLGEIMNILTLQPWIFVDLAQKFQNNKILLQTFIKIPLRIPIRCTFTFHSYISLFTYVIHSQIQLKQPLGEYVKQFMH